MIYHSNKSLLFLSLLLIYIQCNLSENELLVLEELGDEWGVVLNGCSGDTIVCCNENTTVCEMYVYQREEATLLFRIFIDNTFLIRNLPNKFISGTIPKSIGNLSNLIIMYNFFN